MSRNHKKPNKGTGTFQFEGKAYTYLWQVNGIVEIHRHATTITTFNYEGDCKEQLKEEARKALHTKLSGTVIERFKIVTVYYNDINPNNYHESQLNQYD
ncbi:MAG TPA: hypothetical protein PLW44_11955, partial [Chitinophagales bacterium]|nr:hypothetical protein [Chitinophagales bacterium]